MLRSLSGIPSRAVSAGLLAVAVLVSVVWAVAQPLSTAPPRNLSVANYPDGGVLLSWDAPAEAAASVTGYQILTRQPEDGEAFYALEADTGETTTRYTDLSATTADTGYAYQVQAVRGSGVSTASNVAVVVTPAPEADATLPTDTDAVALGALDLGDITAQTTPRFPQYDLDGTDDAVDYFRFTLTAAKKVNVGLRQLDADADLMLEAAGGTEVAASRTVGTTNERVIATLLAGAYYVQVEALAVGANVYKLRYGVSAPDAAEVARLEALIAGPEPVTVPEPVTEPEPVTDADSTLAGAIDLGDLTGVTATQYSEDTINGGDDQIDYFTFSITTPRLVHVGTRQLDADVSLTLEDEEGGVIITKSKTDVQHLNLYVTLLEGTYYVRVEATEVGENEYKVSRNARPPRARDVEKLRAQEYPDPGSTPSDALALGNITDTTTTQSVAHRLAADDPVDYFSFTLTSPRSVSVNIEERDADADLYLLSQYGLSLGGSKNEGADAETVSVTLLEGTYYILVVANETSDNDYVLKYLTGDPDSARVAELREQGSTQTLTLVDNRTAKSTLTPGDDYAGNGTTTGRITLGTPPTRAPENVTDFGEISGRLHRPNDIDWLAISLEESGVYQIDVPHQIGWACLIVWNASFQRVGNRDCTGGSYGSPRIYLSYQSAGTYYLQVFDPSFTRTGAYRIEVRKMQNFSTSERKDADAGTGDFADNSETQGYITVGPDEAHVDGAVSWHFGYNDKHLEDPTTKEGSFQLWDTDHDWYRAYLDEELTYRFRLEQRGRTNGLSDPYLRLFDSWGNVVAQNDDVSGSTDNAGLIDFIPAANDIYYIETTSAHADTSYVGTGNYELQFVASGLSEEFIVHQRAVAREASMGCKVWKVEDDMGDIVYRTNGDTTNLDREDVRVICVPNEALWVESVNPCIAPTRSGGVIGGTFYTIVVGPDETLVYTVSEKLHTIQSGNGPFLWKSNNDTSDGKEEGAGSQAIMRAYFMVKNSDQTGEDDTRSIEFLRYNSINTTVKTTLKHDEGDDTTSIVQSGVTLRDKDTTHLVKLIDRVLAIVDGTFMPAIAEDTTSTFSITQTISDRDFPINPITYCGGIDETNPLF